MSTQEQPFILEHESVNGDGWETKPYDDASEMWSTIELLRDRDLDYEYQVPDWYDVPDDVADAKEPDTDGGVEDVDAEIVDHTSNGQSEPEASTASTESDAEPVEPDVVDSELPDRELHNDPITWLQAGSDEFTTEIKGTTVITKKGFRVLQHRYDITTGSDVIVGPEETDHEFCRVKAWAVMPDGRKAEAHAAAHVDRGDDHFLLTSMADTRAKSRALSDVTGVGAVAVEEMHGVEE